MENLGVSKSYIMTNRNREHTNEGFFPILISLLIVVCVIWPERLHIGPVNSKTVILGLLFIMGIFGYRIKAKGIFKHWMACLAGASVCAIYLSFRVGVSGYLLLFVAKFLLVVISYSFITSSQRMDLLIDVLIGVYAILAVFGVMESFLHYNIFDAISGVWVEYIGANSFRMGLARSRGVSSISMNNCFAYMFVSLLATYRLLTNNKSTYPLVCLILIMIGALFTFSRVPLLIMILLESYTFIKAYSLNVTRVFRPLVGFLVLLVIAYIVWPSQIQSLLSFLHSMFASMFDDSIADPTQGIGGAGDRFELYSWVASCMTNKQMRGWGPSASFVYLKATGTIKESIENAYLWRWYTTGFIGLGVSLVFYLSILLTTIKDYIMSRDSYRKTDISFEIILVLSVIGYLVCGLDANFGDEWRVFYILLGIYIAYRDLGIDNSIYGEA